MSGSYGSRLAGVIEFTIDGVTWNVVGDAEYSPSQVTRETLKGQSAVEGYSEMPNAPFISANLRDQGGTAIQTLNAINSSDIQKNLANGKTVYGYGMWQVGEISVNTQEGTLGVRFESAQVIEDTV